MKISRMSVDYAILERGRLEAGKLPANVPFNDARGGTLRAVLPHAPSEQGARLNEGQRLDKEAYRQAWPTICR